MVKWQRRSDRGKKLFPDGFRAAAAGLTVLGLMAAVSVAAPSGRTMSETASMSEAQGQQKLELWERQLVLPPAASARLVWARKALAPSGLQKLQRLANSFAPAIASGSEFSSIQQRVETSLEREFSGLSNTDIAEAAFIVLAMATRDMDDDLRLIMAEIKATNAAKQKLRDLIKELNEWISSEMSKRLRVEGHQSGKGQRHRCPPPGRQAHSDDGFPADPSDSP